MKIVTAAGAFMDIDAYGGCVAYAELLRLKGEQAIAVTSATLNDSVTKTIRSWGDFIQTKYEPSPTDKFILVDVSDPMYFDPIIVQDKIIEVIDHRLDFQDYWQRKIHVNAQIEFIGAACTQVYELWIESGVIDQINVTTARLLVAGILDNTLNFKAAITTERDKVAYKHLMKFSNLSPEWPLEYFMECQQAIEANILSALKNDIKFFYDNNKLPNAIGQLVMWDAHKFLRSKKDELIDAINQLSSDGVLNIVSIKEGKSYFVSSNLEAQSKVSRLLAIKFDENIAQANRLWLRKEISKKTIKSNL